MQVKIISQEGNAFAREIGRRSLGSVAKEYKIPFHFLRNQILLFDKAFLQTGNSKVWIERF